ncbi:hypothetical protein Pst134EA_032576 [Puccinia striiformis f. sp. tritici]|uniref:uncharacterized protein n=1 Tax=Puccinia striiformis f. sp. tritici TaxID=168172 RepID=UPI002007E532|nr:uncharacterized protein Pst134EA_032576 [Puccinia striiformis f. sp. tritici]KAH9443585.1 hypothetical protein Pst134EA_032576 [Puccinia striiformis f. sp. tritici]
MWVFTFNPSGLSICIQIPLINWKVPPRGYCSGDDHFPDQSIVILVHTHTQHTAKSKDGQQLPPPAHETIHDPLSKELLDCYHVQIKLSEQTSPITSPNYLFPFKTPPSTTTGPSILLFTISKRIPSTLLLDLVKDIQSLSDLSIEPIGCLTEDPQLGIFSASIAKWSNTTNSSESIVPFTSNIHSRTSISVGREIYPSSIDPSTHLDQYSGHAHHVAQESMDLPEELRGIQLA